MMRMADGHGKRIGSIIAGPFGAGKQSLNHGVDLRFSGMANADNGFLDVVWRIFCNLYA